MKVAVITLLIGLMLSFIQANTIHYHYHFNKPATNTPQNRQLKEYLEGMKNAPRQMSQHFNGVNKSAGIDDEEASYVGDADWMYE